MSISNLFYSNNYPINAGSITSNSINFGVSQVLSNIPVSGSITGNINILLFYINPNLAVIIVNPLTPTTGISATRIATASGVIPTQFRPSNDYYTPATIINNNLKLVGQFHIATDGLIEWIYTTFTGSATGLPETCVTYPLL
jgi:hypothetical protein